MKRVSAGFSLVELLVATLIGVMVLLGIGTIINAINHQRTRIETIGELQSAIHIAERKIYPLQEIGGGSLRPWHSLWVEDNCAARLDLPSCNGSDRATVINVSDSPECSIVSYDSDTKTIELNLEPAGDCCLQATDEKKSLFMLNGDFQQLAFIDTIDMATCKAVLANHLQGSQFVNLPADDNDWVGGSSTLVTVGTYYWDSTLNNLSLASDLDNDGLIASGETVKLIDNVFEFQLALGYDLTPSDGVITNTNDDDDEWLYNFGNTESLGVGVFATTLPLHLRQVEVHMVLALPRQPSAPTSFSDQYLNGPSRTFNNLYTQDFVTRMNFRNSLLYR
ncbi:MAG: prepilin-type N-terminal cleavage/methylation domain-containing protein [Pseudobdellovibrionaceae bacterium]|nr:MAG: prepilin-type N-terminal cleavage/methylation domain-containing protein [Pseudobdellovibrionaceae bacterium]